MKNNNDITYNYIKRKISQNTIYSLISLGLSILFLVFSIIYSYYYGGNAPVAVGVLGLLTVLLMMVSIYFTYVEIKTIRKVYIENILFLLIYILFFVFLIYVLV